MENLNIDFRQFGGLPVTQGGETAWYFGWVDDQKMVKQTLPLIAQSQGFAPVWSKAFIPAADWQDDDRDVFLWNFEEKVTGKVQPSWNQRSVGSCVAFGNGRAANDLLLVQSYTNKSSWPGANIATEPIYGGSRVEVGGGVLGNSDGSLGSWAAKWLIDWGVLLCKVYMNKYDLTTYNEQRCREYGYRGVPDDLEPEARLYPVKGTAMVTSGPQAWQALGNCYPIAVCSNQGFDAPLRDGFCDARGSWAHCCVPGTLIAGEKFKKVEDVQVGDMVYGRDSKLHKVLKVHKRHYQGMCANISFVSATPLVVTENHPVLVYRKTNKNFQSSVESQSVVDEKYAMPDPFKHGDNLYVPIWVAASDVKPGDYLMTPASIPDQDKVPELPTNQRAVKEIFKPDLDAEMAFFFGFYIGDGHVKDDHGIGLTLSLKDPIDRLVAAIKKFGVEPRIEKFDTYIRVYADSVILEEFFREWFGKDCYDKQIPNWLLISNFVKEVIDGLHAADGATYRGRKQIQSTSRILIEQLRMALIGLGQSPATNKVVRSKGSYPNASPSWCVYWVDGSKKPSTIKKDNLRLYKVKSNILTSYEGDVYNYDVEETHDYVASGFIVHNCMEIRARFMHPTRGKCFVIQNSWADYLNSKNNPHSLVETRNGKVQLPEGCFATTMDVVDRMLRQQDSFALSDLRGFTSRDLFFW